MQPLNLTATSLSLLLLLASLPGAHSFQWPWRSPQPLPIPLLNNLSPCNCYLTVFDDPLATGDPFSTPGCDVTFGSVLNAAKCLDVAQNYLWRLGIPSRGQICTKQTDSKSCFQDVGEPACSDIACHCLERCEVKCNGLTKSTEN